MKLFPLEDCLGRKLYYDVFHFTVEGTKKSKILLFERGHLVSKEDLEKLKSTGKDEFSCWEDGEEVVYEDVASTLLAESVVGNNVEVATNVEGKNEIISNANGLLRINKELLYKLNSFEDIMIAALHDMREVVVGEKIGAAKLIPIGIDKKKLDEILDCAKGEKVFEIIPYEELRVGILVSRNLLREGNIEEQVWNKIFQKLKKFPANVVYKSFYIEEEKEMELRLEEARLADVELIICFGGMSISDTAVSPMALMNFIDDMVSVGGHVIPGTMLIIGYRGDTPVIGVPSGITFHRITLFDILLPWVFAGIKLTKKDIVELSYGGFCQECRVCIFPNCQFGKM